ncbi:YEATS-associated helix-containing protein [uncultured Chryseobacterium sp.]|uniref:YEATS-associated helix-containing protein n=1 Tax=uncultured Chryseobacterium sp. TaxID=259322 RepID=UPI00345DDD9E
MYLSNIIYIMAFTGVLGGVVNYYSDFNKDLEDKTKKLRNCMVCIFLGIAATIIVPLFLKLADSQLVVNIENDIFINHKNDSKKQSKDKVYQMPTDEYKSNAQTSINSDIFGNPNQNFHKSDNKSVASDYLLWAAYCLLAAAAGMRFIDLLVNKLLTQSQVIELQKRVEKKKEENKELAKEKETLEGEVEKIAKTEEKRIKNYEVSEQNFIQQLNSIPSNIQEAGLKTSFNEEKLPDLPPVKFKDDPQKGRFGGQSNFNGRTLSVSYKKYFLPGFLKLTIKVSADHENNLLKGNVYLFLHDSFADSVVMYAADGKKEIVHEVISYGAFTIGAVTDGGNTMLELDIAEQKDFPEDFRKR